MATPRAAARAAAAIVLLASAAAASDDLGPPELPGPPLRVPFPWTSAVLVLVGAATAVALAIRIARRAARSRLAAPVRPAGTDGVVPPSPTGEALERLAALRARTLAADADDDALDRFHDDVAATLRRWVADAHGVPGRQTTTEEFAAGLRDVVPAATVAALVAVLLRCDLARFARAASNAAARTALLHDAESVVRGGPEDAR